MPRSGSKTPTTDMAYAKLGAADAATKRTRGQPFSKSFDEKAKRQKTILGESSRVRKARGKK